jgi:branched-chain amino acid transport system substrate-binding protein
MKRKMLFTSALMILILLVVPLMIGAGGTAEKTEVEEIEKPPEEKDVILVGILGPMTGPNAVDIGYTMRDGSILAMEEANARGGVNGKKFEWIIVDDEASPATSVNGAKKLIFRDKVDIIVGPANSGCALAVEEVTNPNKIVMMIPGQNANITRPEMEYVFRCSITDKEMSKKLMLVAGDEYNRFGIIHDTTGYGENWYNTFKAFLAERGLEPVADESFEVETFDLTPQVSRIAESNAEILVFLGVGGDVPTLMKTERRIGLDILNIGTNGFGCQTAIELGGKDVEGLVFTDTVDPSKPEWKEFRDKYRKRFNVPEVFTHHAPAQAYDGFRMIIQGLEKTGGEAGEALKNALEAGVSINGATCKVGTGGQSWNKNKHDAMVAEQLTLITIKNGHFVRYE